MKTIDLDDAYRIIKKLDVSFFDAYASTNVKDVEVFKDSNKIRIRVYATYGSYRLNQKDVTFYLEFSGYDCAATNTQVYHHNDLKNIAYKMADSVTKYVMEKLGFPSPTMKSVMNEINKYGAKRFLIGRNQIRIIKATMGVNPRDRSDLEINIYSEYRDGSEVWTKILLMNAEHPDRASFNYYVITDEKKYPRTTEQYKDSHEIARRLFEHLCELFQPWR